MKGTGKIVSIVGCFLMLMVTVGCSKKRPYLCVCYSSKESRSYDIDVLSRAEADVKCEQMRPVNSWDSCKIMLHE